jgi:hypothetical protein
MELLARPIATGVLGLIELRFAALISMAVRGQRAAARRASSGVSGQASVLPLSPQMAFGFLIPIISGTIGDA